MRASTKLKNQSYKFKQKTLTTAVVAAIGAASISIPVSAQDAMEEVVVTGIRGSMQRAMDIKRDSQGVVDAISAEDIGKFPDTNIAESLQRITGVSIDRQNGEGSQVTVRGFGPGFNLVTLNGRTMPTADIAIIGSQDNYTGSQGRSFDFSNIASEGIAGVEVYKTGQALLPSGGLGATINLNTFRPLENPGTQASIGAKAQMDESVDRGDDVTPEVSGLFSWTSDNETFGVSVFGAYSERDSGSATGFVNGWTLYEATAAGIDPGLVRGDGSTQVTNLPEPGRMYAIPDDSRYGFSDLSRERTNAQITLQFQPMDSLRLTADYYFTDTESEEQHGEQTLWFARPFDQIVFDNTTPISTAVFLQENNDGTKDVGMEQVYRAQKDEFDSIGLNAVWDVTSNSTLRFDYHSDSSESTPNNPLGHSATFPAMAVPMVLQHSVDFRSGFPVQRYTFDDSVRGNGNGIIDEGDLASQMARSSTQTQTMDLDEIDLRYTMEFETSRLEFGVNSRETEIFIQGVSTEQALGTWGMANPGDIEQFAPGSTEAFCLSCLYDDYSPGDASTTLRGDATVIFARLSDAYSANNTTVNDAAHNVDESIDSYFIQYQMDTKVLGFPAQMTFGLRYEDTTVDASSNQTVPYQILWTSDDDFSTLSTVDKQQVSGEGAYSNTLPNFDLKVDFSDDWVGRFSYSKTIGRASPTDLYASTSLIDSISIPTVLGGSVSANARNPDLLPLESTNFDVSVEWYYGDASYVSLGYFDKSVENFIGTGVDTRNLFGLQDPSTNQPGTRTASAVDFITSIGADLSAPNLFTLVALMDNSPSVAAAQATFQANLGTGGATAGALPQNYVDQILVAYDIAPDANDPLVMVDVNQPINQEKGNIDGWEFAVQHFFGDSGFGIAANYTMVNGDVDADDFADPSADQFALVGLSDTMNATLIYENYGWSARLSYNWRDDYVNALNQAGSNRHTRHTAEYEQWDMNVTYDFTDNLQVSFEGINLTGEDHRQYYRKEVMLRYAYELHPRYALGVRYKF